MDGGIELKLRVRFIGDVGSFFKVGNDFGVVARILVKMVRGGQRSYG